MYKHYTVYDGKTDEVIVAGCAEEVARYLGIKVSSLEYAIRRQGWKKHKTHYRYYTVETVDEKENEGTK